MLKELEITQESLRIDLTTGKRGRFATVYRGNHHGEVAIKEFNFPHEDDALARLHNHRVDHLREFKRECSHLKKVRHNNLLLFMGVFIHPPRLALITPYLRLETLYREIHEVRHRFSILSCTVIGKQICEVLNTLYYTVHVFQMELAFNFITLRSFQFTLYFIIRVFVFNIDIYL